MHKTDKELASILTALQGINHKLDSVSGKEGDLYERIRRYNRKSKRALRKAKRARGKYTTKADWASDRR